MGLILGSGSTKPQYPYDMWYGVQGDFTSKDYKLTRIGNLDLHRTLPIQNKLKRFVENTDGSVRYYLHQNDSRKNASGATAKLDTTDGNVMLEKPEYYMRFEIDGTKWAYCISEYALPGFTRMTRKTIAPWFSTVDLVNNTAVSGCWLQWVGDEVKRDSNGFVELLESAVNFRGGNGSGAAAKDGTYNSQLGMPRTSVAKSNVRPWCKNGTHIGAARAYCEIAWLQRIEYASLHCQDTYNETLTAEGYRQGGLGSGPAVDGGQWNTWGGGYYPFVPCGVTAPLGNNTGKVSFTVKGWTGGDKVVQVTSYRGLETPFEYLWMLADDVLIHYTPETESTQFRCVAYGCTDPTKFTSHSDNATTIPDGYEPVTDLPNASGYGWNFGVSYDGFTFPTNIGGGANQGMCDQFYSAGTSASGWYGALLSAAANAGTGAGFGCLYAGSRSSRADASIGFRLCRF